MDIQQNQQYQQSNPQNRFKSISSLEALTEYAISALTEKTPSYFHESEKTFTKEIRNYGIALILTMHKKKCKDWRNPVDVRVLNLHQFVHQITSKPFHFIPIYSNFNAITVSRKILELLGNTVFTEVLEI